MPCTSDFMPHLDKCKGYNFIYMFNDTFRYLELIFTNNIPKFEDDIPDILVYPTELQMNKANTSDKETFFLNLSMKVIGSDVYAFLYSLCYNSTG